MKNSNGSAELWRVPTVALVGMGTGLNDLGADALRWIGAAEVLIGGKRHLQLFCDHPATKIAFRSPLADQFAEILEIAREKKTAILASGDPLFFGIGRKLAESFGKDRLVVIPNVTSVQTLCARLCEPWGTVETVSMHGRNVAGAIAGLLPLLERGRKVAVLTDLVHTPQWIARELLGLGKEDFTICVGEDLGTDGEKVRLLSVSDAAAEVFSPLNIVLIIPPERSGDGDGERIGQVFGFPEEAFEREAGMITKMEVRAVALAALCLEPGLILWDIGAGTGSVSIEASRIAGLKRVFAVEKNAARYEQLLRNREKFHAWDVEAHCASASEAITQFPDPDRVFIGGSGDDLDVVLDSVADRLLPGGKVVQTIVLMNTLEKARSFWARRKFETSILQIQASRSVPIGGDFRLEALNPVFVVSAWRKTDRANGEERGK
ncbi:MAG: precorrin-6y C5,15-methyltransferase (decarboxylating) subunit CbiE [Desulfobacteraceae bacterium]|nr:precorrin-6y C5,15-methyltransferase (decarboxylating) subunit CbiE [Desulfobacteraceae bacterium]